MKVQRTKTFQVQRARATKLITKSMPPHALGCKCKLPQKQNVVLYIDKEVVEKSRELGFNLLKTCENHLKQLIVMLSSGSNDKWWARPDSHPNGFESKTRALSVRGVGPPTRLYR